MRALASCERRVDNLCFAQESTEGLFSSCQLVQQPQQRLCSCCHSDWLSAKAVALARFCEPSQSTLDLQQAADLPADALQQAFRRPSSQEQLSGAATLQPEVTRALGPLWGAWQQVSSSVLPPRLVLSGCSPSRAASPALLSAGVLSSCRARAVVLPCTCKMPASPARLTLADQLACLTDGLCCRCAASTLLHTAH